MSLYTTCVRPLLEYVCIVWNPTHDQHNDRIEPSQKQFLLFALSNRYNPLLNKFNDFFIQENTNLSLLHL